MLLLHKLPILVHDRIFAKLSDDDLRSVHQVNHDWKYLLEGRTRDNNRRLEKVQRIKKNKENIQNGAQSLPSPEKSKVNRETKSDKKVGCLQLKEVTNLFSKFEAVAAKEDNGSFLTPLSRFQSFEEAEKSLEKGQRLLQCRRCRGPVPSPITPGLSQTEEQNDGAKSKLEATRCRLTSRMNDVTSQNNAAVPERKKSKSKSKPPPVVFRFSDNIREQTALNQILSPSLASFTTGSPDSINEGNNCKTDSPNDIVSTIDLSKESSYALNRSSVNCKLDFSNISFGMFSPLSESDWPSKSIQSNFSPQQPDESPSSGYQRHQSSPYPLQIYPNLILSPELADNFQRCFISKSNDAVFQKKQKSTNTLNKDGNSSHHKTTLITQTKQHDGDDIVLSTYKYPNVSVYDSGLHDELSLSISPSKDLQQSMRVSDSLSQNSLLFPTKDRVQIKSWTSDYYSSSEASVLRNASKSYFPEMSSSRIAPRNKSFNDSDKSKSRSLGNIDVHPTSLYSFESRSSCPNLNDSFVLECPNPNCSFRFCSNCLMSEHEGRPCRIIDSDSFEVVNDVGASLTSKSSISEKLKKAVNSEGKCKGKGSAKKSLRRIAKLKL